MVSYWHQELPAGFEPLDPLHRSLPLELKEQLIAIVGCQPLCGLVLTRGSETQSLQWVSQIFSDSKGMVTLRNLTISSRLWMGVFSSGHWCFYHLLTPLLTPRLTSFAMSPPTYSSPVSSHLWLIIPVPFSSPSLSQSLVNRSFYTMLISLVSKHLPVVH